MLGCLHVSARVLYQHVAVDQLHALKLHSDKTAQQSVNVSQSQHLLRPPEMRGIDEFDVILPFALSSTAFCEEL